MLKNISLGIKAYFGAFSLISKLKLWKYFFVPILIVIFYYNNNVIDVELLFKNETISSRFK